MNEQNQNLDAVVALAKKAGHSIMEVYTSDNFEVEMKNDDGLKSPLTKADKAAHKIIDTGLRQMSNLPVISEEGKHSVDSEIFWLVDPLDGTKEFIKKNDEFTVNIALIENKQPILGVVYAPALDVTYAANEGVAFKIDTKGNKTKLKPDPIKRTTTPTIITSKSHKGGRLVESLKKLGAHKEVSVGSSLKFCYLAEGKAQAYPRFVPTCLWDTAAADAVLRATGGQIRDLEGSTLTYDPKKDIKNPLFIATARGQDDLFERLA